MLPPSELILRPSGAVYHLDLLPGQVAETIITVGDPERVARVSRCFDRIELRVAAREFVTHTGELDGKRLSVISTGIGTDNVDIVLNELDALFNVDLATREVNDDLHELTFLRLGTSGALQPDLPLDTFLVSRAALAADGLLPFYPTAAVPNPLTAALREHLKACGVDPPVPPLIVRPRSIALPADPVITGGITLTASGFYGPQGRSLRLPSALSPPLMAALRSFAYDDLRITNLEMETAGLYGLATALGHRALSVSALLANRDLGTFSTQPARTVDRLIDYGLEILGQTQ